MTDQPEVTEEVVVTASDELRISRSLVYRLVAKFRTAAAGFANRSGVLILALCTDSHPRAPAKFQRIGAVYDLSGTGKNLGVLTEILALWFAGA